MKHLVFALLLSGCCINCEDGNTRTRDGGSELIASEPERIEQMRTGHADLVRTTGHDFGYELTKWRDFLLAHAKEFGYRHPYAFARVDRAVKAAIDDPEFARLGKLAASRRHRVGCPVSREAGARASGAYGGRRGA